MGPICTIIDTSHILKIVYVNIIFKTYKANLVKLDRSNGKRQWIVTNKQVLFKKIIKL